jgi:hypothetical protein
MAKLIYKCGRLIKKEKVRAFASAYALPFPIFFFSHLHPAKLTR